MNPIELDPVPRIETTSNGGFRVFIEHATGFRVLGTYTTRGEAMSRFRRVEAEIKAEASDN